MGRVRTVASGWIDTNKISAANVLDFDADPLGNADSAPAIQAAIDSVATLGGTVFLPAGIYLINTEMTINKNVNLVGEHTPGNLTLTTSRGTVVKRGADVIMLNITGTHRTTDRRGRSTIRNIEFKDGTNISTKSWFFAKYCDNMKWIDCTFDEPSAQTTYGHVIDVEECWDWEFNRCIWKQYGGQSPDKYAANLFNGADNTVNNWHWVGCKFYNGEGKGIVSDASGAGSTRNTQLHFTRCKFEDSSETAAAYISGPITHLLVDQCIFISSNTIHLDGSDTASGSWIIQQSLFTNIGDTPTEYINIGKAVGTRIVNNTFSGVGTATTAFIRGTASAGGEGRGLVITGNQSTEASLGTTPLFANTGTIHRTAIINNNGDPIDDNVTAETPTLSGWGVTRINSTDNAVTGTLGSGAGIGTVKTIVMVQSSNSSTVSVTNHETSDPEVITFAAVDDTAVLMWTGTEWITIKLSGATV